MFQKQLPDNAMQKATQRILSQFPTEIKKLTHVL